MHRWVTGKITRVEECKRRDVTTAAGGAYHGMTESPRARDHLRHTFPPGAGTAGPPSLGQRIEISPGRLVSGATRGPSGCRVVRSGRGSGGGPDPRSAPAIRPFPSTCARRDSRRSIGQERRSSTLQLRPSSSWHLASSLYSLAFTRFSMAYSKNRACSSAYSCWGMNMHLSFLFPRVTDIFKPSS